MRLMIQIGLIELMIGGLLGWAMVVRVERPEWLKRIGVIRLHRVLQVHLDYIMMGLILIAVGLALGDPPGLLVGLLIFGTLVNPFLFVPLAFNPDVDKRLWFRALSTVSFLTITIGLIWAVILGPA